MQPARLERPKARLYGRAAMKVLALETTGSACSVAVLAGNRVAAHRRQELARGHAEILLPMVAEAMAAAGLSFEALDLVAVTVGPGAFTGIRIGLAAARGLALAAEKPCIGVTTFEAIAEAVGPIGERRLVLAVESRREDALFLQAPPGEPVALPPEMIPGWVPPGPLVVAGDAAERTAALLSDRDVEIRLVTPDAAAVAQLAARRGRAGRPTAPPAPFYLRPPDTTLPKT